MGAVRDAVAEVLADGTLTRDEKIIAIAKIRGQALHAAANAALPWSFSAGVYVITVLSLSIDDTLGAVTLTLAATKSGVVVALDNPFVFVNPPTQVLDPAGTDLVRDFVDRRTGAVVATRRFREAPLLALRQIIINAVRDQT